MPRVEGRSKKSCYKALNQEIRQLDDDLRAMRRGPYCSRYCQKRVRMALRRNEETMRELQERGCTAAMMRRFKHTYRLYLDADEEIWLARQQAGVERGEDERGSRRVGPSGPRTAWPEPGSWRQR